MSISRIYLAFLSNPETRTLNWGNICLKAKMATWVMTVISITTPCKVSQQFPQIPRHLLRCHHNQVSINSQIAWYRQSPPFFQLVHAMALLTITLPLSVYTTSCTFCKAPFFAHNRHLALHSCWRNKGHPFHTILPRTLHIPHIHLIFARMNFWYW